MSDSLQPHGLQHTRLPYPSPSPRACSLMPIELVMPSNHLVLCLPLFLLPSIFPSIKIFSNESAHCIRWPMYWSFSIGPSNEYSGSVPFGIDRFDLLAVQGTLRSLLQHHSWKVSVLQHSVFFMVQLSHPYMTTGKTIALTIRRCFHPEIVGKARPHSNLLFIYWLCWVLVAACTIFPGHVGSFTVVLELSRCAPPV